LTLKNWRRREEEKEKPKNRTREKNKLDSFLYNMENMLEKTILEEHDKKR
jgi:hypothetical protein